MTKPRLLFFSPISPLPVDRGDKNRIFHLLLLLRDLADVRLVCLQRDWDTQVNDWSSLEGVQIRLLPVGKVEVMLQGIRDILSFRPYMAFRFGLDRIIEQVHQEVVDFQPKIFWGTNISSLPFLHSAKEIRCVLDMVDSPAQYFQMTVSSSGVKWTSRLQSFLQWRIKEYEELALKECDCVLISTRRDKEYLHRVHGESEKILVVENCIPGDLMKNHWHYDPERPPTILFVGNMTYSPNISGIRYFAKQVFPKVKALIPQVELVLCGNGSSALVEKFNLSESIRALGFVDDLVSLYLKSSVVVVPVPVAGGTSYKMLEAMALGIPIVASPEAALVGEMTPGNELLVGDTDESFASQVVSVLQDSLQAGKLSDQGKAFISAHHIWENKMDLLHHVVNG
jgi:glycosyltransferase involved in cell wall biosynthesis